MELRIIAELSQDPLWVETFINGGDLHSILCAKTFNIGLDEVKNPFPYKPEVNYRFVQKTVNFGWMACPNKIPEYRWRLSIECVNPHIIYANTEA